MLMLFICKKTTIFTTMFTLLQKCDQNMAQTMSVTDHVCKQIKADFPNIKNVLSKSDNVGCYSGNSYLEGPCHILKQNRFSLIKHDFNDPWEGKDQCDGDSAVAQHWRTVYVNAGHDIQTIEDIKNSLDGVKNAKVSIVEIDSSVNEIKSQKIDTSVIIILLSWKTKFTLELLLCWERYSC